MIPWQISFSDGFFKFQKPKIATEQSMFFCLFFMANLFYSWISRWFQERHQILEYVHKFMDLKLWIIKLIWFLTTKSIINFEISLTFFTHLNQNAAGAEKRDTKVAKFFSSYIMLSSELFSLYTSQNWKTLHYS